METALITGANSGIGRATAVRLSAEGYRVYGAMRDTNKAEKLLAMAASAGGEVEPIALDVQNTDSVTAAVQTITAATGGVERPFGRRILELGLSQFRLAETQKYAHVTLFFNGGYREPLDPAMEQYELIASERVDSFAAAPAMKAREIAEKAKSFILSRRFQFGLINFANADMVGHTGDLAAAIQAVQAVDGALAVIFDALALEGGVALVTADHGNAEQMISANPSTGKREINTRHSLNPVPVFLFDPTYTGEYHLRPSDPEHPLTLANLAATNYVLLGQPLPDDIAPPLFDLS